MKRYNIYGGIELSLIKVDDYIEASSREEAIMRYMQKFKDKYGDEIVIKAVYLDGIVVDDNGDYIRAEDELG